MKRTALTRSRKPLKRSPLNVDPAAYDGDRRQRASTLPRESPRGAARRSAWQRERAAFLGALAATQGTDVAAVVCQWCARGRIAEVHHTRGRVGDALTDHADLVALCAPCHRHAHGAGQAEARVAGITRARLSSRDEHNLVE